MATKDSENRRPFVSIPSAKRGVNIIDLVPDDALAKKRQEATKAVQEIDPTCGEVALFRTTDGHIGFTLENLVVQAGDKRKLDAIYRAIMAIVGTSTGRPRKEEAVRTHLRLRKSLHRRLKRYATAHNKTLSESVEDLLLESLDPENDDEAHQTTG